jgi:hypothetical protein
MTSDDLFLILCVSVFYVLGYWLGFRRGWGTGRDTWKQENIIDPLTRKHTDELKSTEADLGELYEVIELPILWEADHKMKKGDLLLRVDKGFWFFRWRRTIRSDNDNLILRKAEWWKVEMVANKPCEFDERAYKEYMELFK